MRAGGDDFWILLVYRTRNDNDISLAQIFLGVTLVHRCAEFHQALGRRVVRQIRARNLKAQVQQHFGNAAHASTADAHKMDIFNFMFHANLTNSCFGRIAALRGARNLTVIEHTVSASARRAPCIASRINKFLSVCITQQAPYKFARHFPSLPVSLIFLLQSPCSSSFRALNCATFCWLLPH